MQTTGLLEAMADGIGEVTFASAEWIELAGEVFAEEVSRRRGALADLSSFALCEVAHNPPAYLRSEGPLAWHARLESGHVTVGIGEIPDSECTFKLQGDHSIMSNLARVPYRGRSADTVAATRKRLLALSRWKRRGEMPAHPALTESLSALHDALAPRTMPRLVFMTPEWVSIARHFLTTRARSKKYAPGIQYVRYTFAEEFTDTPLYAFPDASHGGFWVRCDRGEFVVEAGPLPDSFAPADHLTLGSYAAVVPVGRTVERAMTEDDRALRDAYVKTAFRYDKVTKRAPVSQSSPSGRGEMPAPLARIFLPLHDEMSKRTSGELPSDFGDTIRAEWATPQAFDRRPSYEPAWLRYGEVDIFGQPRRSRRR